MDDVTRKLHEKMNEKLAKIRTLQPEEKGRRLAEFREALSKALENEDHRPLVESWLDSLPHETRYLLGFEEEAHPIPEDRERWAKAVGFLRGAVKDAWAPGREVRADAFKRFQAAIKRLEELGWLYHPTIGSILLDAPIPWMKDLKLGVRFTLDDGRVIDVKESEWEVILSTLEAMRVFPGARLQGVFPSPVYRNDEGQEVNEDAA